MTVADRKAKEKIELRALILESARKLFVENGIEQTNIRSIAENIDYSIGTVYKYFKDKNAILHALHTQGFMDLGGQFQILYNVKDPMERLRAMGKVYIKFALDQPDMYDLMFNLKAPMEFLEAINEEKWNEGKATFDVLRTTVKDCMSAGYFKGHVLEPLSFLIWSLVHGMCSLEIRQRTKGVNLKKPETIVIDGYNEFLKIMEKL
jgi:AcrR family transcriptional regulator